MKKIIFHILFWAVILFWRTNADWIQGVPISKFVLFHLVSLPLVIVTTYLVLYYLLPKYLIKERNYTKFTVLFMVVFYISITLYNYLIVSEIMFSVLHVDYYKECKMFAGVHPFRNAFMIFSVIGLGMLFCLFEIYLEQERAKHQLQEEYANTQLEFLKSQVNPHFLFNALNNIYSLAVRKNEPEIAKSLENLSGIMRYLSYDSSEKFVPLIKEIQLIENYIDIQQMRISEDDDISISIVINEQEIELNIRNTFFEKITTHMEDKGIGLNNVLKRLGLIYPLFSATDS